MPQHVSLLLVAATLTASTAGVAVAEMNFNRVASFPVADNLPADIDRATPTSSEIITSTPDGQTLVYSDSLLGVVGFIDLTDPKAPKTGGVIRAEGEPTSVTVVGEKVLAAVNTSKSKVEPSGKLLTIDIVSRAIEASCDLGGQPDSVAASKDGSYLAVAIENERDEELNDGEIPQLPAGNLKIVGLSQGVPDCASIRTIDLTGIADVAGEDPEPEFVSFNDAGEIAVTLQENNHIAIVDASTGNIVSHFSAGKVDLENIDTKKDGAISFTGKATEVVREPDAVAWLDNERLVVANEGDYKGGSRGFTIFSRSGEVLYESGPSFEHEIARIGHYPESRNKKGIEPEGIAVATFGDERLIFVASERGSVVGVYKDTGGTPEFIQVLPSGIGPEGLVPIPVRNLLVTANEADLVEDGLARSHVMIYERSDNPPTYPMIRSELTESGIPHGWGALSGLAADPDQAGRLFAVSDSVYQNEPAIYAINATISPALITGKTVVTRSGQPAQKLDIEGIALDSEGGFWLANEGDPAKLVPHAILHVNADGEIDKEIGLPTELLGGQTRFGAEGVAVLGSGDDLTLVLAIQREWRDDPKGQTKLLAYRPAKDEWSAARYPLESTEDGWVGLSEIAAHNDKIYVIERDNLIGRSAKLKAIYSVDLDDFKPVPIGGEPPLLAKKLVRDLKPDLAAGTNGYIVDKVEGFTVDAAGDAYVVTDNDGVDDSSGETLFLRLGKLEATN